MRAKLHAYFLVEKITAGGWDHSTVLRAHPTFQDLGQGGAIPAYLGVLTSVFTTTKRNLHVTDPLAAIFPLPPLGFNH